MISEKTFSQSYSSFWHGVLPLAESFVRRLNRAYTNERFQPIYSLVEASRRGLVNELGFELFCTNVLIGRPAGLEERSVIAETVRKRVFALESRHSFDHHIPLKPTYSEWKEADKLQLRLSRFFSNSDGVLINPFFRGCGILNSCNGDVLSGDTLYEVKAGDRAFRISDIRQLLIYCTLNFESKQYDVRRIGLFNPRVGTYVSANVEQFCSELCGMTATDLFGTVLAFLSSSGVSR